MVTFRFKRSFYYSNNNVDSIEVIFCKNNSGRYCWRERMLILFGVTHFPKDYFDTSEKQRSTI